MAVVFTIVMLVLGSVTYTLSAQMENRAVADTQRRLQEARELILAFAMANGRLPCPASSTSNGDEAPSGGGSCTSGYSGYLPARALGFTPTDLQGYGVDFWGNRIRYAVSMNPNLGTNTFTTTPSSPSTGIKYNFGGTTALIPKDLLVCTAYGTASSSTSTSTPSCGSDGLAATNLSTVVAVVWSQGKNFGRGSYLGVAGQSGADEAFNNKTATNSNHGVFISHPPRWEFETNEFDDHVIWIPAALLYGRMVAAGVLP
jgi:hypothetical protein